MAKASIPGRAKTRLTPGVTPSQAADLNSAFLADISENLIDAGKRACIAPFMAFGPPGSAPFFEEHLPPEIGLMEIWHADFGQCLFQTIEALLGLGYGAACVLNSDSPTLPNDLLVQAALSLARPGDRMVLGPSEDGGYYLLGLKKAHKRLFEDIAWSTDVVAAQTLSRATEIGLEIVTQNAWYDVDDAEMLARLMRDISTGFADDRCGHWPRHSAATLRHLALTDPAFSFDVDPSRVSETPGV